MELMSYLSYKIETGDIIIKRTYVPSKLAQLI